MVQIEWSMKARQGLASIARYIARDNPAAAERVVRGLLKRVDQLATLPELGPPLRGYEDQELRQLIFGHYRIIYRFEEGSGVVVVGVFHAAMDIERQLRNQT